MRLKAILSHPDWHWQVRRDLTKVIELMSNIVEMVTGTRPVTKGNSPLKKVAKQLVIKARAKSAKTGNFLSEEELKEKEHSWISSREISGIEWKESESKKGGEKEQQASSSEDESDGGLVCQVGTPHPEPSSGPGHSVAPDSNSSPSSMGS